MRHFSMMPPQSEPMYRLRHNVRKDGWRWKEHDSEMQKQQMLLEQKLRERPRRAVKDTTAGNDWNWRARPSQGSKT